MEFANWAFMTPEARSEAERGRMAVNAALKATKCTKALCEYALTSKLPEEISEAAGTANLAALCKSAHATCADTPTLRTQHPAAVSSCGDPPTGWTVSNHGAPQRAFAAPPGQELQQENVPPSPSTSVGVQLTDNAASAGSQPGRSLTQHFRAKCKLQSSHHVHQPNLGHTATGVQADVPGEGVSQLLLAPYLYNERDVGFD